MQLSRNRVCLVRLLKSDRRWQLRFRLDATDVVFVASRSCPHFRRLVVFRGPEHVSLPPHTSQAA